MAAECCRVDMGRDVREEALAYHQRGVLNRVEHQHGIANSVPFPSYAFHPCRLIDLEAGRFATYAYGDPVITSKLLS